MSTERDTRLDWLKGLAMALVLLWHLQPISSWVMEPTTLGTGLQILIEAFYWNVTLLGVPLFLVASLRLYYARSEREGTYFRPRIIRLFSYFVFWAVVQWIVAIAVNRGVPAFDWLDIRRGGPDLPLVGGSVFYYLLILVILVIVAEGLLHLPAKVRYALLVILGVAPLFVFTGLEAGGIALPHYAIVNFAPYVTAAYVWARWPERFCRLRWWFTAVWLVAVITQEAIYRSMDLHPQGGPPFARVAVVFGSLALCAWVSGSKSRLDWSATRYLSRYSLGIFALHKYFQLLMLTLLPEMGVAVGGLWVNLESLAAFVPTLALTALGVALLARSPLRRFVR